MSNLTHVDTLDRWLAQATHALPPQQADKIRAEMTAHVEEATEDYIEQGNSQETAYQQALADLGAPQQVNHRFSHIYRGSRHYRGAMLACILLMFERIIFAELYAISGAANYSLMGRLFYIADHVVWASLIIYVVVVLRWLLLWRFDYTATGTPTRVIIGGFAIYLVANIGLELIVDSWYPNPTLSNTSDPLTWLGLLVMHSGMLISSGGTVWLGLRALPVQSRMVKVAAILASVEGSMTFFTIIMLDLNIERYILAGYGLMILFELLLWGTLSLLFFQMSSSWRRLPRQMA